MKAYPAGGLPTETMNTTPSDPPAWSERSRALERHLARSALGDRHAFAELYRQTCGHLYAVVLRIQPDRAIAEDLLQEVYVAVWKAAGGYDAGRAQPLTWLTQIARNRAIDSLRRAQAQPRFDTGPHDVDDDGEAPRTAPARAAAPDGGTGLLRRSVAQRGGRTAAPAAGHGQELGPACPGHAAGVPGSRQRARNIRRAGGAGA
jgi:RNA polymerase sigma-70 factor (ECF subfamily)